MPGQADALACLNAAHGPKANVLGMLAPQKGVAERGRNGSFGLQGLRVEGWGGLELRCLAFGVLGVQGCRGLIW